jgi:hypothetical protein
MGKGDIMINDAFERNEQLRDLLVRMAESRGLNP